MRQLMKPLAKAPRWKDAWFLTAFWVCLMSGIASIVREALALFVPTLAAPSRVFEACAVTCFVISGWVALFRQSAHIRELESRTPLEQHYVQMVEDAITRHGDRVVTLLRHLKLMGEIVFGVGAAPSLPDGMNHSETLELLKLFKVEKIVYNELIQVDRSSPLARILAPCIWRISPGIEPLLDEILYQ